jgi:hypothetical protein
MALLRTRAFEECFIGANSRVTDMRDKDASAVPESVHP